MPHEFLDDEWIRAAVQHVDGKTFSNDKRGYGTTQASSMTQMPEEGGHSMVIQPPGGLHEKRRLVRKGAFAKDAGSFLKVGPEGLRRVLMKH